jgi:hypothetical protein
MLNKNDVEVLKIFLSNEIKEKMKKCFVITVEIEWLMMQCSVLSVANKCSLPRQQ